MGSTVTELTDFSSVQLLTKRLLCHTPKSMVLCTSFTEVPLCSALNKAFALSHSEKQTLALFNSALNKAFALSHSGGGGYTVLTQHSLC